MVIGKLRHLLVFFVLLGLNLFLTDQVGAQSPKREFKVGQACMFPQAQTWKPATVIAVNGEQVEYEYEWGGRKYKESKSRDELRFEWEARAITKVRTWKDAGGSYNIVAAAVGLNRDRSEVVLHKIENDEEITVPVASLSKADRDLLGKIQVMVPERGDSDTDDWGSADTTSSPPPDQYRSWSSSDGKFRVEAIFLDVANGVVKLKKRDGSEISVPLDRLGATDRKLIEEHIAFVPPPIPDVVEFVSGPRLEPAPWVVRKRLEDKQREVRETLERLNIPEKGVRERTKEELRRLEFWEIDESILDQDLGEPNDEPANLAALAVAEKPVSLNLSAGGVPFRKIHLQETVSGVFPVGGESGDVVVGLHTPVFGVPSRAVRISMAKHKFRCSQTLPHGERILDVEPGSGRLITAYFPSPKELTAAEKKAADAEKQKRKDDARTERKRLEAEFNKNSASSDPEKRKKAWDSYSGILSLRETEDTGSDARSGTIYDHFLTVWESDPSKTHVEAVCRWNAKCDYVWSNEKRLDGEYARFLSPTRLIYRYGGGEHIIWDIEERREAGKFTQPWSLFGYSQKAPAVRCDNRVVGFMDDDSYTIMDTLSDKILCRLPLSRTDMTGTVKWSPDGTKLASYGRGSLMGLGLQIACTDPANNKVFDFEIPTITLPETLDWVTERLILLDHTYLFDIETGLVVWSYEAEWGSTLEKFAMRVEQGKLLYFEESNDKTILVLGAVDLPGPGVMETLATVEKTLEIRGHRVFAVEAGTRIRIDVGCGQYDVAVRNALEKKVAEAGWILDTNAELSVRATMAQSTPVSVTYEYEKKAKVGQQQKESFSYTPWTYILQVKSPKTVYWEIQGGTSAAPRIQLKDGESAQQHVQENQLADPSMILSAKMPAKVVDPFYQMGFGKSRIGPAGMK